MGSVENRKGGRKRRGTLEPAGFHDDGTPRFRFRLRLADGTKSERLDVPHGLNEEQARAQVAGWQADEDAFGRLLKKKRAATIAMGLAPDAESASEWFDAWIGAKKAKGQTSTKDRSGHYELHIKSAVGGKHVRDWTADDLRALVTSLDAKVAAGELAAKSARNVWGTATKMCADAVRSKVAALRVRSDNPSLDVEGPDAGQERAKQFLYPSEFLAFVTNTAIPLRWRRAVALAVYMFPRAGELSALRWEDIDLEHGTVHIHRSFERRSRQMKSTKTKTTRRFSLEPAVLPLLRVMHDERGGHGRVIPLPNSLAERLRGWLLRSGVGRRELHDEKSKTTRPLAFHDLRATGLTWMAVRGDEPLKIMQRAGHTDFATTQIYIRTAEAVRGSFGAVFPELPATLLERDPHAEKEVFGPAFGPKRIYVRGTFERETGFENEEKKAEAENLERSAVSVPTGLEDEPRNTGDAIAFGPGFGPVEAALAEALRGATAAGEWATVARLADELQARRLASTNVVALDPKRRSSK